MARLLDGVEKVFIDPDTGARTSSLLPWHLHLADGEVANLVPWASDLLRAAHALQADGNLYVHGDVRPINIMVHVVDHRVADMQLVDMDWAGRHGEVTYPLLINTDTLAWPAGVAPLLPIKQEHDVSLLGMVQLQPVPTQGMISGSKKSFSDLCEQD